MHRKRQKQLLDTFERLNVIEHEELENGLWVSKLQFIKDRRYYINKAIQLSKQNHFRQETIQDKELS